VNKHTRKKKKKNHCQTTTLKITELRQTLTTSQISYI